MDNLNPSEISEIIKGRIDSLETSTTESNEGTIVFLSDGIARVHGLSDAMYGELIEFEGGVSGMALNLERDSVGVVIFGDDCKPKCNEKDESTVDFSGLFWSRDCSTSDASRTFTWNIRLSTRLFVFLEESAQN